VCFFFQAEDGIRDRNVTGVQTCALPILDFHIVESYVCILHDPQSGLVVNFFGGNARAIHWNYESFDSPICCIFSPDKCNISKCSGTNPTLHTIKSPPGSSLCSSGTDTTGDIGAVVRLSHSKATDRFKSTQFVQPFCPMRIGPQLGNHADNEFIMDTQQS